MVEKGRRIQQNEILMANLLSETFNGNPAGRAGAKSSRQLRLEQQISSALKCIDEQELILTRIMFDLKVERKGTPRKFRSGIIKGDEHNAYVYSVRRIREQRDGVQRYIKSMRSLIESNQTMIEKLQTK